MPHSRASSDGLGSLTFCCDVLFTPSLLKALSSSHFWRKASAGFTSVGRTVLYAASAYAGHPTARYQDLVHLRSGGEFAGFCEYSYFWTYSGNSLACAPQANLQPGHLRIRFWQAYKPGFLKRDLLLLLCAFTLRPFLSVQCSLRSSRDCLCSASSIFLALAKCNTRTSACHSVKAVCCDLL